MFWYSCCPTFSIDSEASLITPILRLQITVKQMVRNQNVIRISAAAITRLKRKSSVVGDFWNATRSSPASKLPDVMRIQNYVSRLSKQVQARAWARGCSRRLIPSFWKYSHPSCLINKYFGGNTCFMTLTLCGPPQ